MPRRVPDLTRIRHLLDYRPTQGLDGILADVLAELQSGAGGIQKIVAPRSVECRLIPFRSRA
jgi:hypothetical protein